MTLRAEDLPADVVLPCGCALRHAVVDGVNELTIVACRAGCLNLANAIALADEMNRPVEVRER